MDHEDPTLDVEAALRDEEELAALAELGAASTAPEDEPSATPPGDAAATPGEPGSDAEKAPSGPPQKGSKVRGHYVYGTGDVRASRARGVTGSPCPRGVRVPARFCAPRHSAAPVPKSGTRVVPARSLHGTTPPRASATPKNREEPRTRR